MKNFALALTGMAAISAAPAFAETTYLSFDLGYSELSVDDSTLKTTTGAAAFEGKSGKLTYGAELAGSQLIDADNDSELNISGMSAYIGYDITSAFTLFAGASVLESEVEDTKLDATSATVGVEYTANAFTFGAAYITSDIENEDYKDESIDGGHVYAEYNANDMSAYAAVMFNEDGLIYFAGVSRDVEAYEVDLDASFVGDVSIYALSGSYNIRENIRLNASIDLFDNDGDNWTQKSVGAGYRVADDIWIDASYESFETRGESSGGFGLKVSYEMGKAGLRAADRVATPYDILSSLPLLGSR